jgi:hypothetical protein
LLLFHGVDEHVREGARVHDFDVNRVNSTRRRAPAACRYASASEADCSHARCPPGSVLRRGRTRQRRESWSRGRGRGVVLPYPGSTSTAPFVFPRPPRSFPQGRPRGGTALNAARGMRRGRGACVREAAA